MNNLKSEQVKFTTELSENELIEINGGIIAESLAFIGTSLIFAYYLGCYYELKMA